jgi:glycosyltransferase involved in cell wall biosynthesis
MSIFISIASYRDAELSKTVRSIYDNAENPHDLVFGIVSQDTPNNHAIFDWLPVNQIRMIQMNAEDACGVGYARKIAMDLYRDEDWFLQIDSHMRFAKGWDIKLKQMLLLCQQKQGTDKIILSQFPAPYIPLEDDTDYYLKNDDFFWDKPSWATVSNPWAGVWGADRKEIDNLSEPRYSHTVLAAFIFAPGFIVKEVPYDERICYMGEEVCFAIRSYTRGWHIYAPNEIVCWHFYRRTGKPRIQQDGLSKTAWSELDAKSKMVQRDILLAIERGIYGIDDYEKYLQYQEMIGINFKKVYERNDIKEQEHEAHML